MHRRTSQEGSHVLPQHSDRMDDAYPLFICPHLSKPQATVLALWSLGMVLARSCALTAVATFLAVWLRRQEPTVRQQRREFCRRRRGQARRPAPSQLGRARAGPAAGWVLAAGRAPSWPWPSTPPPWAALHRVGHQRGLSRLRHAGAPGRSCPPTRPMPGAASGGACGAPCDEQAPRAGPSSCWPTAACMPAGCCAGSCAWAGLPSCASTAGAPSGPTAGRPTAR